MVPFSNSAKMGSYRTFDIIKSHRVVAMKPLRPPLPRQTLPSFAEFISFTFHSHLRTQQHAETFQATTFPKILASTNKTPGRSLWCKHPQSNNLNKTVEKGTCSERGDREGVRQHTFVATQHGQMKAQPETFNSPSLSACNLTFPIKSKEVPAATSIPPYKSASPKTKGQLQEHLRKEIESLNKKRRSYRCSFCPLSFEYQKHLISHVKERHQRRKPFGCPRNGCRQRFGGLGDVNRHVKTVHDGEKRFSCHLCERCFSRKTGLKRHLYHVHQGAQQ